MEKKYYIGIIILIVILIAVGIYINHKTEYNTNNEFDNINNDNNTFIVGYDATFAPFTYEKNGNVTGFDVELAQELCKRKGWNLILKPIDWDLRDEELNNDKIDCVWSGFSINGRENQYAWSKPYCNNQIVPIVKNDSTFTSMDDLDNKTVQVQSGSTSLDYIENNIPVALSFKKIIQVSNYDEAFDDLESGKCDMILVDKVDGIYMINDKHPNFKILNITLSYEQYGVGFQKDNITLRNEVQETLDEMFKDGTVDKIAEKYSNYGIPENLVRP